MAYTARQLITRAWYLSGIVGRGLQSVTGDQLTDGLNLLNSLLDWKAVEIDLIPYYTYFEFPAIANTEEYFIPNCVGVETATFNDGVVRYSMTPLNRAQYFGSGRVDNISTLPGSWTFNRSKGGGTLYLYFKPDAAYPIKIMAKFAFTNVGVDEDLTTVYDGSYLEYLRYALAQYMCSEYGIIFNPQSEKILNKIQHELMYESPPDLILRKSSMLTTGSPISYADISLGKGWRPS